MKKKNLAASGDANTVPSDEQVALDLPFDPGLSIADPETSGILDYEVMSADAAPAQRERGIFLSDELLLPDALNTYRKPVAAIHAIPMRRDMALKLSARKLMEALPLAVQLDLRSRGRVESEELIRKIREDRATPLFEIRTKELCRLAGISFSNMERIHESLADLVGYQFIWNVLHEDGNVEYEAIAPFLIRRDKGVGSRSGYTRFAFEPEILLWFLEPKMWASFSWAVTSSLGGRTSGPGQEAAFGLYQNIWRYIGTSAKITPALAVADWIDLAIGPSRFVQVEKDGSKRVVDYKDFKRRYLMPALTILNGHPALNHTVEVKEETSGRRVMRLRFKFIEKKQTSLDLPLGWPTRVISELEGIGFTQRDIANLSQLYPFEQVTEALKRLPLAEKRQAQKGARVYSRKAFFTAILGNVAKGEAQTAEEESKQLREAEKRQQQEDEARRMEVLTERFRTHQRTMVLNGLRDLSDEERSKLFEDHLAADPSAKVLFRGKEPGQPYLVLFFKWLAQAKQDLYLSWLPDAKDQNFQSWLAWQVTMVQ